MTTQTTTKAAAAPTQEAPPLSKVYTYILERITALIENNENPWRVGFDSFYQDAANAWTGYRYQGVNTLLTAIAKHKGEYKYNLWLTWTNIQEANAKLKKGEKSPTFIIYFGSVDKRTDAERAEMESLSWSSPRYKELAKKVYKFIKYTNVWNIDQLEEITPRLLKHQPEAPDHNTTPIERAEAALNAWSDKPEIQTRGNQPAYYPKKDYIKMPMIQQYPSASRYYSDLFHEAGHATGHADRLNREEIVNFGDLDSSARLPAYSREELTAELTSAFICGKLGIATETDDQQSAAYLKGWLKPLKDDPKMIVSAASAAQKAANYILNQNPNQEKAK